MPKPFYRADQVGSLLRPPALMAAREAHAAGTLTAEALRAAEDTAIADVVRQQEACGFAVVTDGEFRRENWWIDFVRKVGGVRIAKGLGGSFKRGSDHDFRYVPLNVLTETTLSRPSAILVEDYRSLAGMTKRAAKITMPSPSRMHFHGGREAVSKLAYPDMEAFFADIAKLYQAEIAALEEAGCRLIQIDDPLLTYFISDDMRVEIISHGEDPDERLRRYVALINACIAQRRADTRIGIHLCRGNSRSGWMTEGGYERIAEIAFGGLAVDSFYLEFDDARSGGFEPLRFIPAQAHVVLGLVTTKFPELETMDALRRRVDEASAFVPLERLGLSPQCGFASTVEGNLISPEVQWAKLTRVIEAARAIWGTA
ncbi:MAG: 5-methyltetrahydropteroyltriglutamate--homocysteine S-methyltransferase [Beijerinckiaceae bacterium]